MGYRFKLTPIGKAAFEIMQYVNDAKSADIYSTLEYIAQNPLASKALDVVFKVPISEDVCLTDILKRASVSRIHVKRARKQLNNLVRLGALEGDFKDVYSITLAGHDVCVTYRNLYDIAHKEGLDDKRSRFAVLEWLHITSQPKSV
ncbi:MAG: hypothetical protein NTY99_03040 [DPANN group archaeon]|nr:hypothetical protein [DPANN group archaeon]